MIAEPWVEKYKPQKIRDLIGNNRAIAKITEWLQEWPKTITRNRRALMLYGPSGVGKTIAVYTIARELGFEISEINASVKRSKKRMSELLRTSTMTQTLTSKRGRLVLVDELAGLSGKSDRGAASALNYHIKNTRVPIILVTNDVSDSKISPLKKICTLIEFEPFKPSEVTTILKRICKKEKLTFDEPGLELLATYSRGDIRAAINDLQSIARTGANISKKTILELVRSRDHTIDIREVLDHIFYAENWNKAVYAANQSGVYPDELLRWISNNVPIVFTDINQQVKAFDLLSKASIFASRISRTQNWRLLPYSKELMCITGSITDGTPTPDRSNYQFPEWIRQMGFSRGIRQKRIAIGQIISPIVRMSAKKAYKEYLIVLKAFLKNPHTKPTVTAELKLTEDLIQFILKD
ncbi:MAG: replication factor C large subunit [Promethearchaeota archaeon]